MEAEIHLGVRDPEDVIKELRADVKNLCEMITEMCQQKGPIAASTEGWIGPDWVVMARCKAEVRKAEEKRKSSTATPAKDSINIYGAPGSQWTK